MQYALGGGRLGLSSHKHQVGACPLVKLVGDALELDRSNIFKAQLAVQFPSINRCLENRVDPFLVCLLDSPADELLSYSAASIFWVDSEVLEHY